MQNNFKIFNSVSPAIKGARRCEFGKPGCMEGCKHEGRNDGTLPEVFHLPRIKHSNLNFHWGIERD